MRCNKNFRAESTTEVGHVGLVNRPCARILERFDPDGFSPASIPHARSLDMETPVGWLPGRGRQEGLQCCCSAGVFKLSGSCSAWRALDYILKTREV